MSNTGVKTFLFKFHSVQYFHLHFFSFSMWLYSIRIESVLYDAVFGHVNILKANCVHEINVMFILRILIWMVTSFKTECDRYIVAVKPSVSMARTHFTVMLIFIYCYWFRKKNIAITVDRTNKIKIYSAFCFCGVQFMFTDQNERIHLWF